MWVKYWWSTAQILRLWKSKVEELYVLPILPLPLKKQGFSLNVDCHEEKINKICERINKY